MHRPFVARTLAPTRRSLAVLSVSLLFPIAARAQTEPLFYRGLDYGSQSTLTPLTIWLHRGFEAISMQKLGRLNWNRGVANAWGAVTDPGAAVRRSGGWKEFVTNEIIPFVQRDPNRSAWFPNYTNHLIAGGIDYRYVSEWYASRGVPHPRLMAAVTGWSSAFMNEVVESEGSPAPASSSVADLLIFDLLAAPLFEIDGVARLFSGRVRAFEWSPLVSLAPGGFRVENAANQIAYKFPLPFVSRVEGVYTQGMDGLLGAMADIGDEHHLGGALGLAGTNRTVDPETLRERVDLVFSWAIYWDRNDSLMGSVLWEPGTTTDLLVNVYPGALPGPARNVGVWVSHLRDGGFHVGIASRRALGLGLRVGRIGTR